MTDPKLAAQPVPRLRAGRPGGRRAIMHAAMAVESVDLATRRVSGLILPYGEWGHASVNGQPQDIWVDGPGLIELPGPDELERVKLTDEHGDPPLSVGPMVAVNDTPAGLRAEFHVVPTSDGDRVLAEMTADADGHRARDGFSVELVDLQLTTDGYLVTGRLHLVAAVVAPAFENAREDGLAASRRHPTGRFTMLTAAQRARLRELLAIAEADRTDDERDELTRLTELSAQDPDGDDGQDGDDDGQDGDDGSDGQDGDDDQDGSDTGSGDTGRLAAGRRRRPARRPARRPDGVPGGGRRRNRHTVHELAAATARVMSGRSRPELEAALADVTSTANIWTAPDEYGGQLWEGLEYQRQYVQNSLPGNLSSYKGVGWKWVVKPAVDDYAGDKAAVPSNSPTTEQVEWAAARLAGGHDLDRKFFDFGDTEFIEAYFAAMREDYAMKSDTKARLFQLASAVDNAGSAGVTLWHALAKASQAVYDATNGMTPDWFYISAADKLGLINVTADDVPAYLEVFGITPEKLKAAPGVAAGDVVAGIKQATKFRELSGSPIRVEALNIANGGVDGGVFGYYATQEAFEGGIQKAHWAAA